MTTVLLWLPDDLLKEAEHLAKILHLPRAEVLAQNYVLTPTTPIPASASLPAPPNRRWQLVRRDVARADEERQRAIVGNEMFGEEFVRLAEALRKQPPQPPPAAFAAISPNGTPICVMPNGPEFMPTNTMRFLPSP